MVWLLMTEENNSIKWFHSFFKIILLLLETYVTYTFFLLCNSYQYGDLSAYYFLYTILYLTPRRRIIGSKRRAVWRLFRLPKCYAKLSCELAILLTSQWGSEKCHIPIMSLHTHFAIQQLLVAAIIWTAWRNKFVQ